MWPLAVLGGFGRSDQFEYDQHFSNIGDIRGRVLLEVGTASGKEPTELVKLQSYLGKFLQETGRSLGADDEDAFEMRLLHFRRTFVEKLFAIHSKVEKFKQTGIGIGGYARHYYDLFCLAERNEVLEMLLSDEYEEIKADYDRISRKYFESSYLPPPDMNFAKSEAIFPGGELEMIIAAEFEKQCRILCFKEYPTWEQLQERLRSLHRFL